MKSKDLQSYISEVAFEQEVEEFFQIKAILLWVLFTFLSDGNTNSLKHHSVSAKQGGL